MFWSKTEDVYLKKTNCETDINGKMMSIKIKYIYMYKFIVTNSDMKKKRFRGE